MSEREIDAQPFPRGALITAMAMVGFALLLTSAVRLGIVDPVHTSAQVRSAAQVTATQRMELRFLDTAAGEVLVENAVDDSVVRRIKPGQSNFIRGVLRGLARDRKMRGADSSAPFTLTRWSNGELTLDDKVSGRHIELASFGETNRQAFDRLLPGSTAPAEIEISPTRGFGL